MNFKGLTAITIFTLLTGCSHIAEGTVQRHQEMMRQMEVVREKQAREQEAEAAIRAKPFNAVMEQINQYKNEPACDTPTLKTALTGIAGLRQTSVAYSKVFSTTPSFIMQSMEGQHYHTNATFSLADAALKKKCLDIADAQYRGLIELYVGSNYGGVRDRARVGLDDVREARRNAAGTR